MDDADVVIIGGGPGGLAAVQSARSEGAGKVVLLERNSELGGILPQCIHNGFGLELLKEDLTGPEYARRYIENVIDKGADVRLDTMVLELSNDKIITAMNPNDGLFRLKAKAVVLAMGCRERTAGAITLPGSRPSGIFTAGTAQRFINIHGYMPGRSVVVLGSGDVGLIMARRMKLEGADVKAVLEIRPYLTGLLRNKVQCLDDFGIPLRLGRTVTSIHGQNRLSGVGTSAVDNNGNTVPGSDEFIECDTLLTSVGLIPENELSAKAGIELDGQTGGAAVDQDMETTVPGIFACGNALLVNDLVDDVSKQGTLAGTNAALFAAGKQEQKPPLAIKILPDRNVRSIVPQKLTLPLNSAVEVYVRVTEPEVNVQLKLKSGDMVIAKKNMKRVSPGEMVKLKLKIKDEIMNDLIKTGKDINAVIEGNEKIDR